MMDVVKTERNLTMVDDCTNDASGTNLIGAVCPPMVSFTGSGGGTAPVTPKESTKSQSVRRTVTKPIFEKDKYSFLCDLQMFHDKNGTPFAKLPKISGRDVDLHKLYSVVIGRGGWMKVNAREDWDEVIEELDLPTRCVNNEIALKQIYIRFLDRYERVNYHGEDKDPGEDEDDEKRLHRRWTVRALHTTPSVYNHHQHNVPEALRSSLKLSEDLYRASEYDKLILSLLSPLPNEQDFAINVCTLMSNENKHTLKIDRCPRLVYALLAHAGVFNHFTLRDTFDEYYSNIRKNSLQRFWKECLFEKPQVLELSMEDYFAKMDTDPSALIASIYQQEEQLEDAENDKEENETETDHTEVAPSRLNMATLRTFLCLGTGLGTNDYIGQRVLQIASIFRNLSFNEENLSLLGHNRTFIRFLIMCSNARWNNLHHLGLDMLGNIANEIDVNDPQSDEITRCLLSTVSEGLEGADRGVIISCLEVLSKLAQKEANEDNLNRCLNQQLYDQITLFLFLNDIMLLLYTLECIYSLTSMGEKPCQAIMHVRGVLDTLVSLVTVEAQSYGPDACILMRVVETIPGNMAGPQGPCQPATPPHGGSMHTNPVPTMAQLTVHKDAPPSGTVYSTPEVPKVPNASNSPTIAGNQTNKPMPALSVTQMVTSQPASPATGNQMVSITRPPAPDSPQVSVNIIARADSMAANTDSRTVTGPSVTQPPTSSLAAKHMQQQQVQESEQFACAWLRASFEMHTAPAIRTDQQEVYKLYMATNAKLGRKVIVPPSHFPRCVRTVFGASVGPVQFKMEQNGVESISTFYEGLKVRAKPLSIVHKGTVLAPNIEYVTASSALSSAVPSDCAVGPKQVPNAGTTAAAAAATSSTTTLTTVPIDVFPNGSRLAGTSVVCSAKGHSLPVPSLTFTTPTTVAPMRSSSVIATAPPASSAPPASQSVGSVVQKTPPLHTPTAITTQPQPKTHISKHLAPAYSSTPATVTVTAAPSSTKQQLIVTQVGGKSVLINQPTATTGGGGGGGGGQQQQYLPPTPSSPLLQQVLSGEQKNNVIVLNQTTISPQPQPQSTALLQHQAQGSVTVQQHHHHGTGTTTIMNQSGTISSTTTNPSALIKSLLANKVTTSAVPESTLATAVATAAAAAATTPSSSLSTTNITPTTNCLIAPNVNVRQVAQRQQLQKQKQMIEQKLPGGANASVVVTSNNPNNLTNIKVGNSTISIKPGTLPTNTVITATNPHEALNAPPPLAPLSQPGSQGTIIKTIMPDTASQLHQQKLLPNKVLSELLEKKPGEMIIAGETTIKRKIDVDATAEPPVKRIEVVSGESGKVNAADLYAELAGSILAGEELEDSDTRAAREAEQLKLKLQLQQQQQQQLQQQQLQQQLQHQQQQQQQQQFLQQQLQQQQQQHQQQQQQQQQQQMISMPVPMQRQIIVTPNSGGTPQMIISAPPSASNPHQQQHLTTQTTATIKTDTGYQTVPIILQHNAAITQGSLQIQKTSGTSAGPLMQQAVISAQTPQPPPTQYILATNPQGQTYVVAQQAPVPQAQPQLQQTVLLAQGPSPHHVVAQQQHGSSQKTIIIVQQPQQQQPQPTLQQPPQQQQSLASAVVSQQQPQIHSVQATAFQAQQIAAMQAQAAGGTQKIFVNQQGQQILMTQLPRQVIVSHAGMAMGGGNPPGTAIFTSAALSSHLSAATTTSTAGTMLPAAGTSTQQVGAGTIIEKKPIYITTNAQGNTISFEGPPQQLQVQTSASGQLQLKPIGPGTQVVNAGGHIIQQTSGGQQTIQFIQQGPPSQQLQQQPQATQQIVFQAQSSPGPAQIIQQQIIQPAPGQQPQQIIQKVLQQQLAQATKPNQSQIITMQKQTPQQTVTIGPPSSISIQRQSGGIILPPKTVTSTPLSATPKQQIIQVVQQKLTTNAVSGATIASQQQQQHQQAFVAQRPILPSVPQTTTISQTVVVPGSAGTGGPMPTPAPIQSISVTPVQQTAAPPVALAATTPAAPTTTTGGSPSTTPAPAMANTGVPATNPAPVTSSGAASPPQTNVASQPGIQMIPPADPQKFVEEEDVDPSWPWICDWRGCPKKKFNSATEVFRHACLIHCPDTVDLSADIYCQWGPGATLCDNLPRKRFSLMTHIFDRHCTAESFKAAVQRRLSGGPQHPSQPYPVTLIRQPTVTGGGNATNRTMGVSGGSNTSTGGRGSPAPATCTKIDPSSGAEGTGSAPAAGGSPSSTNGPGQLSAAGPAALHAIKRHTMEYVNSKEFQDEMEGPVTKSIRLTSALILRNLVVYSHSAKRNLRAYEAHLAGVALSNVESSRTVAQLLFEMNDTQPNY